MMFKTALATVFIALLGSASAAPYVRPQANFAPRDIQVLGVRHIPAQVPEAIAVRGEHYIDVERRVIAEEVPTKSDHGDITLFRKRDIIPAEIAVTTDANGDIIPYGKRDEVVESHAKRAIPAEVAVKTDPQGNIVEYGKRDAIIAAEIAVKTDGAGNIVPY